MFEHESIYIAGPECFYPNGFKIWHWYREQAEIHGFTVTLPNHAPLKLDHEDLRKNADEIFANCANTMNASTVIIANLEAFRGSEPDGGTVFEIGMAFAKGAKCYGYTRDKRAIVWKNQKAVLTDGRLLDEFGREHPYYDLGFCPSLSAAVKIIEGDFIGCLKMLMTDIEEEVKTGQSSPRLVIPYREKAEGTAPRVYHSGPERYDSDAGRTYERMRKSCEEYGIELVTPHDVLSDRKPEELPIQYAAHSVLNNAELIMSCDAVIANLNDFRGWEPTGDTAFECGMSYQWGKKMFGYMEDTRRMRDRVPNLGAECGFQDACGCNVENFDYPINLMFASSMEICEGDFHSILEKAAESLLGRSATQ